MTKLVNFSLPLAIAGLSIVIMGCSDHSLLDENVLDETYVHKYGVAVPSEFWESSGEHGAVVSTMADGVVVSRSYTSGMLDGDTTYTYPHSSQIQKSESYQMGTLVKETEYFFDGSPKWQVIYQAPGEDMRSMTSWYLTGSPKSIEHYYDSQLVKGDYFTAANQRDAFVENGQGTRIMRDDYGVSISNDRIENGQMTLCQNYYSNGSPKETIPYKNGQIDGVKRAYQPGGEPDTIEQWVAGRQEGMALIYQHGEKFAEVPYFNGEKHGVECRYRDGSVKVQEISWHSGQMYGPSTTYVGDTEKTEWYYKGKSVSKADYEFIMNHPPVH